MPRDIYRREGTLLNIKTCEKKEKGEAEIVVDVSPEEFEAAVGKAFMKNRNQITIPGFRRGKAPRKIVERMLGPTTFHADALEILFPDVVGFAKDESGLRLVGRPGLEDVEIREDDGGADFKVVSAVYPEATLGEYKGLRATRRVGGVAESEIDSEIETVRTRNASMESVDRPAKEGDLVVIDYEGFIDGKPFAGGKDEDHELELGSGSFIPGFEEKLLGIAAGEEREIDLVFPEDYEEGFAGKPAVFKVKACEVREKLLPDLDDEFAKDVSEFDTFEEYKASIREKHEKAYKEDSDIAFENELMDMLAESIEADVPDVMVDEQQKASMKGFVERLSAYGIQLDKYLEMTNTTPEEFRDNMRQKSEKQVRISLALEKIAELEGIEVSAEDIENDYKEASERYGTEIGKLKESTTEEDVAFEIKKRRAVAIVVESAVTDAAEPADK